MLTNLESQLREQGASDKLDEVLEEIPRVRKDLGMIPLVTPTSQIVGTQAVINVLQGERYKVISNETSGVLKGEYGATAIPVNAELQKRVLDGSDPVTCRPADLLEPELENQTAELTRIASEKGIRLADAVVDDVLTYALFPQIGLMFLENRDNPDAFEPAPTGEPEVAAAPAAAAPAGGSGVYSVRVNGKEFTVEVAESGQLSVGGSSVGGSSVGGSSGPNAAAPTGGSEPVVAVLAGNIFKVHVAPGATVKEGDPLLVVEAMKMETAVAAPRAGTVTDVFVAEGDKIKVGDALVAIG
jgi:oxaloacetate decarboxylase alpha subunit